MAAVSQSQAAILAPVPEHGRFLVLGLRADADPASSLERLRALRVDEASVVGVGRPLVRAGVPGLRPFPGLAGPGCAFPSTQGAIFAFFGGVDAGEVLHRASAFTTHLGPGFFLQEDVQGFKYAGGRDLSGYEDGTENPEGDSAVRAAIVVGQGEGLDGGSFVATQRWAHDLTHLAGMRAAERDALIGRTRDTNEEIGDAPASAHVKRAAQESFEPSAFMVRRSMPCGTVQEPGLFFVAYGATLDAYERVLHRMAGLGDGITDGLLRFTRAVTGGYYFCPPVRDGGLDLRALSQTTR
jgi:putative iron-dependent peroxidase